MTYPTKRLRLALLGATLIAGAGAAAAVAQTAPTFDPAQLPATKGRVAQYSLTPRGDVDGLILDDGTEVHLPPHLGAQLAYAVKPGDQVTVRGLRAREVPMVQAMQVTNDATSQSVTDTGPGGARGPGPGRHADAARQPREATARAATSTPCCWPTPPSPACRRRRHASWRRPSWSVRACSCAATAWRAGWAG